MNRLSQTGDLLARLNPARSSPLSNAGATAYSPNQVALLGAWVVAAWVFISFSRFFDLIGAGYKIPGLVYYTMIAFILISGAIPRSLSNRMTIAIVVFTVWIGITLPFSTWRSNSLEFAGAAFQCLVTFVAISGLTVTGRQCLRMIYVLGGAVFVGACLSFFFGDMETGRLELARGSFKDPNEYAMTLLMGLPLLALIARSSSPFLRIAGVGSVFITFYVFLKAGSRGGMIALVVVGIVIFLGVSLSKKVMLLVTAVAALTIGFAILPSYLRERYVTFFSVDEAGPMSAEEKNLLRGADVTSTESRVELLIDSLVLTAKHPLVGVGPGNFAVTRWSEAKDAGIRKGWNVSHNTYTQYSSEIGIPGVVLFLVFLYRVFRALRRVSKEGAERGHPELALAGYHLLLSFVGLCVAAFFLSIGYSPAFYVLGAIALSLERVILQPVKAPLQQPARVAMPSPAIPTVGLATPAPIGKKIMSGREVRALMRKV
jgi:O-antigen ligase